MSQWAQWIIVELDTFLLHLLWTVTESSTDQPTHQTCHRPYSVVSHQPLTNDPPAAPHPTANAHQLLTQWPRPIALIKCIWVSSQLVPKSTRTQHQLVPRTTRTQYKLVPKSTRTQYQVVPRVVCLSSRMSKRRCKRW